MEIGRITGADGSVVLKMGVSETEARTGVFRVHRHTETELCYIAEGSGVCRVRDKTYAISAGDFFIFRPDEPHCMPDIYATKNCSRMTFVTVHFKILWLNLCFSPSNGFLKVFVEPRKDFNNKIDGETEYYDEIIRAFTAVRNELETKRGFFEASVPTHITNLLIAFVRANNYLPSAKYNFRSNNDMLIEKSVNFIDENFCKDITLNELANIAHLNGNYYSTLFKRLNGMSPWDYILIKRIEKAAAMLKNTNETVLQIAMGCGFNNTANFNKAFKKLTGTTPKEIRKSSR